jgi:hypothetical protein
MSLGGEPICGLDAKKVNEITDALIILVSALDPIEISVTLSRRKRLQNNTYLIDDMRRSAPEK